MFGAKAFKATTEIKLDKFDKLMVLVASISFIGFLILTIKNFT